MYFVYLQIRSFCMFALEFYFSERIACLIHIIIAVNIPYQFCQCLSIDGGSISIVANMIHQVILILLNEIQ